VCCSVLQCDYCPFVRNSEREGENLHCSTLQRTTAHCNTLHHTVEKEIYNLVQKINSSTLQHTATQWNLQSGTESKQHHRTTLPIFRESLFCLRISTHFTLQHTATHCNTLQHTATHCNTLRNALQHTATHCNTLQRSARHCNTLQHTATHCKRTILLIWEIMPIFRESLSCLKISTTHCNTLQHTATHCNTLQHTTTHCNTLQRTAPGQYCRFFENFSPIWESLGRICRESLRAGKNSQTSALE